MKNFIKKVLDFILGVTAWIVVTSICFGLLRLLLSTAPGQAVTVIVGGCFLVIFSIRRVIIDIEKFKDKRVEARIQKRRKEIY